MNLSLTDMGNGMNILDFLKDEVKNGGTLSACPDCGLPRCERGGYIRCSRCGINWEEGANLDVNPRRLMHRGGEKKSKE